MSAPWTTNEIKILRAAYPSLPKSDVLARLHSRSWAAIVKMAFDLGIRRHGVRWKKVAAKHTPVFALPTDLPIPYKRPWT